ncbi:DUF1453 domain-containing protein [Amycolatopsis pigmentata]|uniref:DUF1453 domain-containing protein n=1 Tax=Amycolatopsis pigmentata TaxID=450801 RepID=A0ABW5FX82_9PSEU
MSGPLEIVLIIAAVGYVLARRLLGEPVDARRTLLLPAVLTGVGFTDLTKVAQSPVSIGFLVGTTVISLVLGLLRGASIRVFEKDGVVHLRYTVTTLVLWAANLVVKFGAGFALGLADPKAEHAASSGLMLTLGAGLLVEGLAVMSKAMRTNGRMTGAMGRGGQAVALSPLLDGFRDRQDRHGRRGR